MNRTIKRLLSLCSVVILAVCFPVFSSAQSANRYGLGLSVSAEEALGESVALSFELKNANGFDVEAVSITPTVPVELQIVNEAVYASQTLKAGESIRGSFSFAAVKPAAVYAAAQEQGEEKSLSAVSCARAAAAVLSAVAVIILALKHKKSAAMMMALFMLMPFFGVFGVHAVGVEKTESFCLSSSVALGEKEYEIKLTVYYKANSAKNSYFELETNPDESRGDNATVTRMTADFSGVAVANEGVESVTYKIENDFFEDAVTGTAELVGCDWGVQDMPLRPGENEITITATLENGEAQTKTYTLHYDSGEIYEHGSDEVRQEDGTKYVENMLNIFFEVGTSDERIDEILAAEKAVRIGEVNGALMVQARVIANDLAELEAKAEDFYKYSEVVLANVNTVLDIEADATPAYPNDPWYYNTSYSYTWDESLPAGSNWSAEAVQAPSAWSYDKYFSRVNVGVIDGGFYTDHEDYNNLISFPNELYQNGNDSTSSHGTHVAGIIGAAANNGKGITGLLWDVNILGAGYKVGSGSSIDIIVAAVTAVVESGAKAVNLSIGLTREGTSAQPNPYLVTLSDAATGAAECAACVDSLLDQKKEFVIVQAAGNGTVDTRLGTNVSRSDDATNNGLFCSIKSGRRYGRLSVADVQNVYDRILVVGAVQNMSNKNKGIYLPMCQFSNGGERVDIYAPGASVFSCTPDYKDANSTNTYKYRSLSGTSQAAPHVTAIAGLCFAINPNFTGAQVKSIICDDANSAYTAYDYSLIHEESGLDYHPFEDDGKVISMKLCAEAALRTVCGKASYTYLNQVVSAAQLLDPEHYTNYDTVQAIIDTIDYNLYEFEQDKVKDKANELIAAMDKLEEKPKANYDAVDAAVAQANKLVPAHYVYFSGVTAAVNAVVYGKYEDEQAAVDKMAQDILDAIEALELKQLVTSSHYNVIVDNLKMLIVITVENLEDVLSCLEAGGYTVNITANKFGIYSTGSTVTLTEPKSRSAGASYKIAALGDINGDGKADGEDAFLISLYINGDVEAEEYMLAAYDADCSGTIDAEDVALLERVGLYTDVINNTYTES